MPSYDAALLGLGNPGPEHVGTRHNLGYEVVDALARRYSCERAWSRYHALVIPAKVENLRIALVKPLTYMNRSGETARALRADTLLDPSRIWAICDDFQLPLGTLRMRPRGSDGGHNGLKSLIAGLGTEEFPRLRLGIGRGKREHDDIGFVLSRFDPEEHETVRCMIERAADALIFALTHPIELAMSRFNGPVSSRL